MPEITDYTASVTSRIKQGFARPSRYEVQIHPSKFVAAKFQEMMEDDRDDGFLKRNHPGNNLPSRKDLNQVMRDLSFSCSATTLPGVTLDTFEQNHGGATRKLPTKQSYFDIVTTFYCSRDHFEYRFFHNWMKLIVNYQTHTVAYHKDYASTITIRQLDEKDKVILETKITEAYPIQVSPISLTYGGTNTIEFCSVTFAWR